MRDEAPLAMVARYIESLGIEAIVLPEQTNRGMTIIEKLKAHGGVGFAVVVFTPDDVGRSMLRRRITRARQNVVLEPGYFMGKLGRGRHQAKPVPGSTDLTT